MNNSSFIRDLVEALQSGQSHAVAPLTWEFFNHLDAGMRRHDVVLANGQSGFIEVPSIHSPFVIYMSCLAWGL